MTFAAVYDAVTGRHMVRRFTLGEGRAVAPLLEEWLFGAAQGWFGVAFLPIIPFPSLTTSGILGSAVESHPALAWVFGIFGLCGWVAVVVSSAAWLGQRYPIWWLRVAVASVSAGFWVALATLFTLLGSQVGFAPYLVFAVLAVRNVNIAYRNGHLLQRAMAGRELVDADVP